MYSSSKVIYKLTHLLPILPVYFIIITVTLAFFLFATINFYTFLLSSIFYCCSAMTVLCHSLSMCCSPGINERKEIDTGDPDLFCKKCNSGRLERTRHCKVCNRCIIRMDHHCPWVANCIGQQNQKYFYLFLFYATLGNFIAFFFLLYGVINIDFAPYLKALRNSGETGVIHSLYMLREPYTLFIGLVLSFAMTISIGFLLFIQTSNFCKNITTLESIIAQRTSKPSKYESPTWEFDNFKQQMGDSIFMWLNPFSKPISAQTNNNLTKKELDSVGKYLTLTDDYQNEEDDIHINLELHD